MKQNSDRQKNQKTPINAMDEHADIGIAIKKMDIKKADFTTPEQIEQATQFHRDEGHTFHIVEKGTVKIEIDFKIYTITAPCLQKRPLIKKRSLHFFDRINKFI